MMLCEKCGAKEAVVHYRKTVNGNSEDLHLCAACAKEMGVFPGIGAEEESLFGLPLFSGFGGSALREEKRSCPICGTSLNRIRKTGKFGCSGCYETFRSMLDLTPYVGKGYAGGRLGTEKPQGEKSVEKERKEDRIAAWREELKRAVAQEDYESAAKLRDKIRSAEEK